MWYYNIHDIVKIESEIPLQELSFFRTDCKTQANLKLSRKLGVQNRLEHKRTLTVQRDSLRYSEHLGELGANFEVKFSDIMKISVGSLLSISKPVLYTNVIEPMLRFLLISNGYVLLHSACLSIDGEGILLSAKTDTGKTGTVLKCLQDPNWSFLSDDMTIIDSSGRTLCFPKPLTISYHTVSALNGACNGHAGGAKLHIQSKVHSKRVRRLMHLLGRLNIPILTLNALGQIAVPPPKYPVWNLLKKVSIAKKANLTHLVFLEKGSFSYEKISREQALARALQNTEDAYGFPPYHEIVKNLILDSQNYVELKKREKLFLRHALNNVENWVLRVPDHSWYEHLLTLMTSGNSRAKIPIYSIPWH